ncbi:MAG: 50S ribosomal protein L24 [Conexivisphaerales archaeon]
MKKISHIPKKVRTKLSKKGYSGLRKLLGARLSDALREKYKRRSLTVRKGDTVKVLRGDFKNIEGKVTAVYPAEGKVAIEGVTREKVKGGTVQLRIHASKLMITNLNLDDKRRRAALEGRVS